MDVKWWLSKANLEKYLETLEQRNVGILDLWAANHVVLREFGIDSFHDRTSLLAVKDLMEDADRLKIADLFLDKAKEVKDDKKSRAQNLVCAIEIKRTLAEGWDWSFFSDLASLYYEYGDAVQELEGAESALEWYEKALAIASALVELDPENIQFLADKWSYCSTLAFNKHLLGPKRQWFYRTEAFEIGERLLAYEWDDLSFMEDHFYTCVLLGEEKRDSSEGDSLRFLLGAYTVGERLIELDPENEEVRFETRRIGRLISSSDNSGSVVDGANAIASSSSDFPPQEVSRLAVESNFWSRFKRASTLMQALGLTLFAPAAVGMNLNGMEAWMGFFGGALFLQKNQWFRRSLKNKGFQLTSDVYSLAVLALSFYFVAVLRLLHGHEPTRMLLLSVLVIFFVNYLSNQSASLLKMLKRSFSAGKLPQTEVTYLIYDSPKTADAAVSPMFFTFIQRVSNRVGRRHKGVTERNRFAELSQERFGLEAFVDGKDSNRAREENEEFTRQMMEIKDEKFSLGLLWRMARVSIPHLRTVIFEKRFKKKGFILIDFKQLQEQGEEFQDYVLKNAGGMLTLGLGSPSIYAKIFGAYVNYKGTELNVELAMIGLGDKQLPSDSPELWRKMNVMEHCWGKKVAGPWYVIFNSISEIPEAITGFRLISVPSLRFWRGSARHVVDLIAQQAVPSSVAAANLSKDARSATGELCSVGLAPVADAYLRFRTSESGVERFLNLFDCFEALIKFSYFIEKARAGELPSDREGIPEVLGKPSMGHWIGLLREVVSRNERLSSESRECSPISGYWSGRLREAPRELIDAAQGAGLAWTGAVPRSHIAWLDWLVWLRNKTKGHGGVIESTTLPLWQQFHQVFGDAVLGLDAMVFGAGLLKSSSDQSMPVRMQGSIRGPFRRITGQDKLFLDNSVHWGMIEYEGVSYSLAPYVIFEGESCLTWNGMKGKRGEYVDYATGKIKVYEVPDSW